MWNKTSPANLAALTLFLFFLLVVTMMMKLFSWTNIMIIGWKVINTYGIALYFELILELYSLIFSSVVLIISMSVMMFSNSYMSGDKNLQYFILMVLAFILSMNLLIYIPNMIFLLLGWDGLGLSSYLLVIYFLNDNSLSSGMVTALSNRVGDALLIMAIALSFPFLNYSMHSVLFYCTLGLALILTSATFTKSAQIPFSAWLPAAMAAPTPVSALVHSSTLVTAGVFVLFRFYSTISMFSFFSPMLFYSGCVTCCMASMAAFFENDFKKIIALSTLSQLGVMMISMGLNQPYLSFFHLLTHALFKALLFICAGTIIHSSSNSQDIRHMGGLWSKMPATITSLNLANLSLCGIPFMAGFYSKDYIMESFLMNSYPISTSLVCFMSLVLTSAYSMRMALYVMWSPSKNFPSLTTNDESLTTYLSYITLGLGAIFSGNLMMSSFNFSVDLISLPLIMKIMTLTAIMAFAIISFIMISNGLKMKMFYFFNTMWYLSFLTGYYPSLTTLKKSLNMAKYEQTWMEMAGGKGMLNSGKHISSTLTKSYKMTSKEIYTTSALFILILIIMW